MVEAMRANDSLLTQRSVRESMMITNKTSANFKFVSLKCESEFDSDSWVVVVAAVGVRQNCEKRILVN